MTPTSTPASEVGYCTSDNCVLGTYCIAGINTLCPEGKYTFSTGSTACTENCPSGRHSVLGARTVDDCTTTACSAGYYCVGGVKTACADGKWSNPGSSAAADCTTALCTAHGSSVQCSNGYLIGAAGATGATGGSGSTPAGVPTPSQSTPSPTTATGGGSGTPSTPSTSPSSPSSPTPASGGTPGTGTTPSPESAPSPTPTGTTASPSPAPATTTESTKSSSSDGIFGILGMVFGILGCILSVIALCKGRETK